MKLRRRSNPDDRIGGYLRAGLREQHPPDRVRAQIIRSASEGLHASTRLSGNRGGPGWITPSNARRMQNTRRSNQERKYGYMMLTANFRLAW